MRHLTAVILVGLVGLASAAPAAELLIESVTVVDPIDGAQGPRWVHVVDGRIAAVAAAAPAGVAPEAERIDGRGRYLIPGLVDGHVHLFQSGGLYTRPDILDLRARRPYPEELASIRSDLAMTWRRTLACGITAVADVGGPFWTLAAREQAADREDAPQVIASGPLISSYQPEALRVDDPPIIRPDDVAATTALAERIAEAGADLLKIWFIVREGETAADHLPMVEAVVAVADRHGLRVAVHATELATARLAVAAGADILVHSIRDAAIPDDFLGELREREVLYCPTLLVGMRYAETFAQGHDFDASELRWSDQRRLASLFELREVDAGLLPRGLDRWRHSQRPAAADDRELANLRAVHAAGITVVAGTDAGNIGTLHGGSFLQECRLMVRAGLTPLEVLHSATVGGAHMLGLTDEVGRVRSGYRADLVLLDADPRTDVGHWSHIARVIRAGRAFTPAELVPTTPERVVRRFANASTDRDRAVVAGLLAPDVTWRREEREIRGRAAVLDAWWTRLREAPLSALLVDDIASDGQEATVDLRWTADPRRGDAPWDETWRITVDDGRISRIE